ncbi:hypothetical protein PISL3812_02737 [Talaromyces islandicus]|uniref:tRNA-splicing endonuclease subunit Sen15 domain-containing protein n=1 Tax=Talaromyces islandicus TaxID=28573 RepID=A0A0U1LSG4_TALIS|nr:hypothetical protein PISL3812_02737 [Talaromyces islandicus]
MTLPTPSALTTLISQTNSDPVSALTTQVLHNLQHQHLWTSLETHQLFRDDQTSSKTGELVLPPTTYLISGVPPHRVYTHPDEQLYLLELGLREHDLPPERMLVLPTTQGQSWSLGKLAAVFDSLPTLEPVPSSNNNGEETEEDKEKKTKLAKYFEKRQQAIQSNEWGGKRVLFAMVDRLVGGDGTVVYYIFQEGIVKPRQN